jgi:phosphatidylglycerophosphate synthase
MFSIPTNQPEKGRKITRDLENPFDNVFIDVASWLNTNIFRPLNYTPNMITTISLLLGVSSGVCFHYQHYLLSVAFLITAYILDCADGNFARTYDMETAFGDYYDHVSDLFKGFVLIIALIYHPMPMRLKQIFLGGMISLNISSMIHMGCQERIYNDDEHDKYDSLSGLKNLCGSKSDSLWKIRYTRYFGVGTLIVFVAIMIFAVMVMNRINP